MRGVVLVDLPETLPGSWSTPEGMAMAQEYATHGRDWLAKGTMSDFELANAVYMADRRDLDLIVYQTAAKERIRWLSVQLALRDIEGAAARDAIQELYAELYKAWPHAEDMGDGTAAGVGHLIEQLAAERDKAREALREIVTARPGWRVAAERALAAMDEPA